MSVCNYQFMITDIDHWKNIYSNQSPSKDIDISYSSGSFFGAWAVHWCPSGSRLATSEVKMDSPGTESFQHRLVWGWTQTCSGLVPLVFENEHWAEVGLAMAGTGTEQLVGWLCNYVIFAYDIFSDEMCNVVHPCLLHCWVFLTRWKL